MLFITGDCHGRFNRFSVKNFPEQKEMNLTKDDYVLILGDCGLIFDPEPSKEEQYYINWLNDKNWTTLFIDGNHDNHDRLNNMPEEEWNGGKIHRISDSIYHLKRGEFYDICGKKCFVLGGAKSHDIDTILYPNSDPQWKLKRKKLNKKHEWYRTEGVDWWSSEVITDTDKENALTNLDKNNWQCDYVFTHTPPQCFIEELNGEVEPDNLDPTAVFLDDVKKKLDYQHWFCGHMHKEKNMTNKDHCLYAQILQIA